MNPAEFANIARVERDFWWYRGMREILFRVLDPVARERTFSRVLEAGCGTGYLSKVLAERYQWNMTAVDLASQGLAYAHGLGVRQPVQADIAALPFPADAFEMVISMDVIVHFPRGEESRPLLEFARILRRGGMLVVRVSALDVLRSRHSMFAHERQRFTKRRLVDQVERAGFKLRRVTYCNSLLLPVALFKFRVWEPLTSAPPASGVAPVTPWLDRALCLPLQIEAAAIRSGLNLPAGQSLLLLAEKP
jgi:ubiquinone/menaquinone biosynthesis C-methylase UbiE